MIVWWVKQPQMPTAELRQGKVLFEAWTVEMIMFPFAIVESNARRQFVHLHLWTAGLVTITGPGKKTLQSHYNNDSNSGQDRRSLCRPPLLLLLLLFLSLFPTSTLTFNLSFHPNVYFCPLLAPLKSFDFECLFYTLQSHTYRMTLFINALLWLEFMAP